MPSIKAIAAGYEAEMDIPDDDQVMDALRYDLMHTIAAERFQLAAVNPHQAQLTAIAALQAAINAARDAALPELKLTPE